MKKILFSIALSLSACLANASDTVAEPLNAQNLQQVKGRFNELIRLANKHDLNSLHNLFWQSPSALLVAKSAVPAEGNWAGYWGNAAIDKKLHDIAGSGPVVLTPDEQKLKVVGLTRDVAQSYAPVTITVSYAGQDGTPKPFLLIVNWLKVKTEWKVASEIILPVPPTPQAKA